MIGRRVSRHTHTRTWLTDAHNSRVMTTSTLIITHKSPQKFTEVLSRDEHMGVAYFMRGVSYYDMGRSVTVNGAAIVVVC